MQGSDYKLRITQAVQEAFSEITPDPTPSGSHRILMIGQLVVNIQDRSETQPYTGKALDKNHCCKCQK